jgi:hypothetical protein
MHTHTARVCSCLLKLFAIEELIARHIIFSVILVNPLNIFSVILVNPLNIFSIVYLEI